MAFNWHELTNIISTIEDLLFMSEPHSLINISTGSEDDKYDRVYTKLRFPLKNGSAEIILYYEEGFLFYNNSSGENIKCINFDDKNLSLATGSFKKALKQILSVDRQYSETVRDIKVIAESKIYDTQYSSIDSSVDEIRKSFVEVN
jgi:hypothetical protein